MWLNFMRLRGGVALASLLFFLLARPIQLWAVDAFDTMRPASARSTSACVLTPPLDGSSADSAFETVSACAAEKRDVYVLPGNYNLGKNIHIAGDQRWEFSNAKVTGPGVLEHSGDWSVLRAGVGHAWLETTSQSENQFGTFNSLFIGETGAATSYEKATGYDVVVTGDRSLYTSRLMKDGLRSFAAVKSFDAVARQMSARIEPGNETGRIWGLVASADAPEGTDGTIQAAEFDVINGSQDQPYLDQVNTKVGVTLVAMGSKPSTAAIVVTASKSNWNDGIILRGGDISRFGLRVLKKNSLTDNAASIDMDGNAVFASVNSSGGTQLNARHGPPSLSDLRPGYCSDWLDLDTSDVHHSCRVGDAIKSLLLR